MTDPWDWYIHLHEWLIFMVHVGVYIYIPYMDPMGITHIFKAYNLHVLRILKVQR